MSQTIKKINYRKILDKSLDSFLFIITHCEELPNLDLSIKKNEIKNIIFSGDLYNSNRFNQAKFLITKFSNLWYQKYLEKQKYIGNIIDLHSYLKSQISNKNDDPINYAKKLRKIFKEEFFNNLNNKDKFKNFHSLDNEFKKIKSDLNKEIKFSNINQEYDKIINEFINLYIFYKENSKYNKYFENDFKQELKQLFINSRKSYKKSLEKSVVTFILLLQNKLEKINYNFLFEKVNVEIENDTKKKEREEELNQLQKAFSDTISLIKLKIQSFTDKFNEEVNTLSLYVSNMRNVNEIERFVSILEEKKKSLQDEVKIEINELTLKISEKIKEFNIDNDEFEAQNQIPLFDWKHITAHVAAIGVHIGLGIAYAVTSIVIPGIGFILAGVGAIIHSSIFGVRYYLKKNEELQKLINSIGNYSESFNDHLEAYKSEISQTLENLKDSIIIQINEKYEVKKLHLDEIEQQKFKEIMELFQKNIEENFNLE